jgi:hypothetical protein
MWQWGLCGLLHFVALPTWLPILLLQQLSGQVLQRVTACMRCVRRQGVLYVVQALLCCVVPADHVSSHHPCI